MAVDIDGIFIGTGGVACNLLLLQMNRLSGLLLLMGLCPVLVAAQDSCTAAFDTLIGKTVYTYAHEMPVYPGGHAAMLQYIARRLRITDDVDFQARFVVDGVVDVDGTYVIFSINGHAPAHMSVSEQSMLRTIRTLGPWIPGRCRGNVVPVRMKLPFYL